MIHQFHFWLLCVCIHRDLNTTIHRALFIIFIIINKLSYIHTPDSVLQPPRPGFPLSETPAARPTRGLQAGVPTWKALHPHGPPQRRPNQEVPGQPRELHLHNNGFGTRPGAGLGRRAAFPGNRLVLSLCVRCEKVCRARGSSSTPCAWYFFSSWCP